MGKVTLHFAGQKRGSLTSWLPNDAAVVSKLLMGSLITRQ